MHERSGCQDAITLGSVWCNSKDVANGLGLDIQISTTKERRAVPGQRWHHKRRLAPIFIAKNHGAFVGEMIRRKNLEDMLKDIGSDEVITDDGRFPRKSERSTIASSN
jgi:hypothetical protein